MLDAEAKESRDVTEYSREGDDAHGEVREPEDDGIGEEPAEVLAHVGGVRLEEALAHGHGEVLANPLRRPKLDGGTTSNLKPVARNMN